MKIETINTLQGTFLNVFMSTMDRVARLEAHYSFPATLGKELARLHRCIAICRENLGLEIDHTYSSTKQDLFLTIDKCHPRMGLFGCSIDLLRLKLFIVA